MGHSNVKTIQFQVKKIIDDLNEIYEITNDSLISREIHSLAIEISTYKLLISLCVWYDILSEMPIVSKSFQNPLTNLETSAKMLKALLNFSAEYRANRFEKAKIEANNLSQPLEIKPVFKKPRLQKEKRMFQYERVNNIIHDPEEEFKHSYFLI